MTELYLRGCMRKQDPDIVTISRFERGAWSGVWPAHATQLSSDMMSTFIGGLLALML